MRERIGFQLLPARARRLAPQEIRSVFGGCGAEWDKCAEDKNCCDGYKCDLAGPNPNVTYCRKA